MTVKLRNRNAAIPKEPGRYRSFPTLVKLPDGGVLMQYRDAEARPGTFSHGANGDIRLARCKDGAWEPSRLLYRHQGRLEDMNGDMSMLQDGSIVLFSRQWDMAADRTHRTYVATSRDNGTTFSERQALRFAEFPDTWAPYGKVIELPGGSILMGAHGRRKGEDGASTALIRSDDRGATWEFHAWTAVFNSVPATQFFEPFTFLLPDGTLYSLLRTSWHFFQTRSCDRGKSWETPSVAFEGMAGAGLVLSDGKLLFLYRGIHPEEDLSREERIGLIRRGRLYCCRISGDGGATWSDEMEIDPHTACQIGSYGMGDAVELPDGTVKVVYYTSDREQTPWIEECELSFR